ncbi:unnamed protein product [Rotaria sp. Silwood2]|nr:unnamed protein product [Rotaria sp. Silwood2]
MKVTQIPYCKEVLVMVTSCNACGNKSNEVKSGTGIAPKVEGILTTLKSPLTTIIIPYSSGDSEKLNSDQNQRTSFLNDISAILAGDKFVTIALDDPASNCYLQNICAPEPDPQ